MRHLLTFITVLLFSIPAFSAGKISGKVTDEKTGEAVIGATVLVKGTTNGTITDIDGNFNLNADAGDYVVSVKYIGYTSKEVDDVKVSENGNTTLNITITEANSTQLTEVVVRSSLKKENISALYTVQKNAATISDGISADVIRKSPDRSTGEVLKRVSGTTIQDNKFVIVRGLSDRYNIALIDNSILPSTEPNRRAFSFDIIPASMIDNIVITKAATPDVPGDFAGGIINILTKETPDQNFNSLSLGTTYNTAATGKTFKSGYRSSTDFLGYDDGARKLPSSFPSSAQVKVAPMSERIALLSSLNNDFAVREHKALPGINFQASAGRVYRMKNANKLGITAALTYNHNELRKENMERLYGDYNFVDNVYSYSSNLGALLNAGYYFGGNKILFKTLYNHIFEDNFLYREGLDNSSSKNIRYYAFDLVQKSLFKTSLEGEHQLKNTQSKIGWILAYNNVSNNQPDQRKVAFFQEPSGAYVADVGSVGRQNNRLFGDLNENIYNGAVNYTLPFDINGTKNTLKIGVFEQYRTRDFNNRYLGADVGGPDYLEIIHRPIETLFAQDVISKGAYTLEDGTLPGDKYTATASTSAGYAMLDNKITDKLRVVWGARFEAYKLNLKSEPDVRITPNWNDLLPSANFTYSLTQKSNLRASYFRSVARPELREISAMSYYDYELNAIIKGNINLKRSQIDNFDLRYEIYPKAGEVISASVFYKHFNQTIENKVYGENSGYEITAGNYNKAQNIGAEIEIRKNLDFIAPATFLKDLSFYANIAYIKSKVPITDSIEMEVNGHYNTERTLSGQSPYVINTSLSYAALDGKLNFNVLYNRIGQRLFLVGQSKKGNVYELPRNLLDLQASYAISKKSEIRVNIKDILNNKVRFYFDQDNNGKFDGVQMNGTIADPNHDWIYQQYRPGTNFSLTYSYRF